MLRFEPFRNLLLARVREALREPEVIFWVFFFPILMAVGLGLAFRNKPPDQIPVGVVSGEGASAVAEALDRDSRFTTELLEAEAASQALRLGRVAILVEPGQTPTYRFDPTRPESVMARGEVDEALQRARGRKDAFEPGEVLVSEPGARYIDFLIPGLLGMNLMSGGLWGAGFAVVDMRQRKLLKRLIAAPMRRSEFIAALMASRVFFMFIELVLLLLAGWLIFDVSVRGSYLATLAVGLLGALTFGAIGILVASRAEKIESVSGLMNLVMLPMFVFSGIFFSAERFPELMQPVIQLLPLTMLNDTLRAVIIEGATLGSQSMEVLGLAAWGSLCFALAVRWFRWT